MNQDQVAKLLIDLEKTALVELNNGNPSGYLKIYAEDITYFDPFKENRFVGLKAVQAFYEGMGGIACVERYEMIDPLVHVSGEMAVLSYNLVSYIGKEIFREKCTEVYRQEADRQWRIIHSHWSVVQPANGKE